MEVENVRFYWMVCRCLFRSTKETKFDVIIVLVFFSAALREVRQRHESAVASSPKFAVGLFLA